MSDLKSHDLTRLNCWMVSVLDGQCVWGFRTFSFSYIPVSFFPFCDGCLL